MTLVRPVRWALCVALPVLLSACFGPAVQYPSQGLSAIGQVYNPGNPSAEADAAPAGSKKSSVFAASYQDVYRATLVGVSQNQINVENENRSRGYILGTRAIQMVPLVGRCPNSEPLNGRALPMRFYYVISVKEKGPKATEVVAAVKAQGTCWSGNCFESVDKAQCAAYSTPHWATAQENPDEALTQLMVFIRNNLIAAGAL